MYHEFEEGDESVRRSYFPARHGNKTPSILIIRLRPDDFYEPPRARPSEVPLG
jgi:hypothetical protein